MKGRIIGRKACPWCKFPSAHVKKSEGKLPYHHCPECGCMTPARNGQQARHITSDMRPEPDYTAGEYAAASQAVAGPPVPPPTDDPIVVTGVVVKAGVKTAQAPKADPVIPAGGNGLWAQLTKGGVQ